MVRIAILDHAYSIDDLCWKIRDAGFYRAYDLAHADVVFLGHARHATPESLRRRGYEGPIVMPGCSCSPQPEQHDGPWLCSETATARDIEGLVTDLLRSAA